jgi:hypothetical protein
MGLIQVALYPYACVQERIAKGLTEQEAFATTVGRADMKGLTF